MIKQDELAFMKTTGEALYILKIVDGMAQVRRPVVAQEGIKHLTESFFIGELETLDEQRTRFMAERKEIASKFGPQDPSAAPDPGFGIN